MDGSTGVFGVVSRIIASRHAFAWSPEPSTCCTPRTAAQRRSWHCRGSIHIRQDLAPARAGFGCNRIRRERRWSGPELHSYAVYWLSGGSTLPVAHFTSTEHALHPILTPMASIAERCRCSGAYPVRWMRHFRSDKVEYTFVIRRAVVGNRLAAVALSTAPPGLANNLLTM